jgi:sec-independent protein translocase protein TatB
MLNMGPQELLLILVIALIVVGPQRLPELSRQIGRGLREFRKVQDEVKGMVKFDLNTDPDGHTVSKSRPASPTAPGVHRTPRPAATIPPPPSEGAASNEGPEPSELPAAPEADA